MKYEITVHSFLISTRLSTPITTADFRSAEQSQSRFIVMVNNHNQDVFF